MALRIRIEHGQDAGTTWRLAAPGVYRFGRSPRGSVQVLDMKVSKDHFEILVGAQSAALRDLGSTHGTLLNQQKTPTEPRPLNPGDEIRAGLTVLRVLSDGAHDQEAKPVGPLPAGEPVPPGLPPSEGAAARTPSRGGVPSAAAPDPLVGTLLAGYRLLERVGAGGMGSVYRAEQLSLHREVALKVLSDRLVSDSAFVDQFVNEARAAGQLNHPNVVQVYDVGQDDGRHFFSMEFIHGGTVESRIPKSGGGVPWQDALNWFLDAANALIFAEKKGILHRDIKPDNFMVSQDGSVKLCDLGLAKKSESADLLAQGIIGTPHFIAPEAIRRRTEVDRRADLYSLGCTFFRIFTGRNPFPAPSVKDILLAHLNAPVPRVSGVVPDFPKDLDDVVFRLMQKDPAQRYPSAEELWQDLDKIRLQYGMEAHGLHPGRAKKFAVAGIVVAVAAVGTLIYLRPWETRTIERTNTITVRDPQEAERARQMRETNASLALSTLTNEVLSKVGRLEDGETWRKEAWEGYAKRYEAVAKEYEGTAAATQATREANRIREYRSRAKAKADALAAAVADAAAALDAASKAGLKAAREAGTPLDAEKAISDAIGKVREAGKAVHDGQALVAETDVQDHVAPLEALRRQIAEQVRASFHEAETGAKGKAQPGTAEGLEAAAKVYEDFVKAHPEAAGDGAVAQAWNEVRRAAETAGRAVRGQEAAARRKDLDADRRAYFAWLWKAYAPRADDGTSGDYAAFRFGEAADGAEKAAKAARTVEYRALLESRAAEAGLVARLPGLLSQWFSAKVFNTRLTGTGGGGWSGVPKGFTPVGVQVGDKVHLYADEGLGWFVELFFEREKERYTLDADGWEALGVAAEAATIQEAPERFAVAEKAFQRAMELDAGRRERLARRLERAKEEQEVRRLLDESDKDLGDANDLMKQLEQKMAPLTSDVKKAAAARQEVLDNEAKLRGLLETARTDLLEVERRHPNAVGRALVEEKDPPPEATYAGEPPPPPPPPAAPAPTPGMKDKDAKDGTGTEGPGKDGAGMDGASMEGAGMGDAAGRTPPGGAATGGR